MCPRSSSKLIFRVRQSPKMRHRHKTAFNICDYNDGELRPVPIWRRCRCANDVREDRYPGTWEPHGRRRCVFVDCSAIAIDTACCCLGDVRLISRSNVYVWKLAADEVTGVMKLGNLRTQYVAVCLRCNQNYAR